MVSEDDLIRTVSEAFAQGWRQVKLYFMCGLPTEEDDDVVQIADMAHNVIRAGRAASGRNDVRCTISIGGFVPKPHTPFQWAAQAHPDVVDARLRKLREAVNADRKLGRNVGMRYHDGQPSLIEGLLARGDRRVGRVIERVWREGGRFDGWSEHFSYQRWIDALRRRAGAAGRLARLVHHPRARPRRGPALGPPRLRAGARLAVGRLAGRARRPRAGRLPLDAVLRLRRVPVDGHRHRGRAERDHAAAADGGEHRSGGSGPGRVAEPDLVVRVADERDEAALAGLRRAWLEERAGASGRRPGFRGRVRAVVAPRAATADVLAGRGRARSAVAGRRWARSTSSRS